MADSRDAPSDAGLSNQRELYAEFDLVPELSCACPLTGIDGSVATVSQQRVDDTCHTDLRMKAVHASGGDGQDSTEVFHATSDLDEDCPCSVFDAHECVPRITEIDDGRVRIETFLPDRDVLTRLVDSLGDVSEQLHLLRLKRIDGTDPNEPRKTAVLELDRLTEKQREAATKAVIAGYYATPRETSLGELAEDLGISKSALSQRLSAVESKLATSAFSMAKGSAD